MDIDKLNKLVDASLADILGSNGFREEDLQLLIITITNQIFILNDTIPKKKLRKIVDLLINSKYTKYYFYDHDSSLNVTDNNETDSCQVKKPQDLISHQYDYPNKKFTEKEYLKRNEQIIVLKAIPQHEQKSQGWFNQRNECLTATAVATALDEDPYKHPAELLLDKCGKGEPFIENENVHHGKKYEQIGNMHYSFRNNIDVKEYGLIQHCEHKFIGASPDGICEPNTLCKSSLSKLVGRLIEIKFPAKRKIITEGTVDGDICPHYYYAQVQTQLFVTEMDECDFLQFKVDEYETWEKYIADKHESGLEGLSGETNLEKGCLIELLPKELQSGDAKMCLYGAKYLYPPELHMKHNEIINWIAKETMNFHKNPLSDKYTIGRIIYWRFSQIHNCSIKKEDDWMEQRLPLLKQFWNYIKYYRNNQDKLNELQKYIKKVGTDKTQEIFERVHAEYSKDNPKTKYKPLYQETNMWRQKYIEKASKYAFYNKKKK